MIYPHRSTSQLANKQPTGKQQAPTSDLTPEHDGVFCVEDAVGKDAQDAWEHCGLLCGLLLILTHLLHVGLRVCRVVVAVQSEGRRLS